MTWAAAAYTVAEFSTVTFTGVMVVGPRKDGHRQPKVGDDECDEKPTIHVNTPRACRAVEHRHRHQRHDGILGEAQQFGRYFQHLANDFVSV
jgi:hypothetical protein